jgi:hypothetical protein
MHNVHKLDLRMFTLYPAYIPKTLRSAAQKITRFFTKATGQTEIYFRCDMPQENKSTRAIGLTHGLQLSLLVLLHFTTAMYLLTTLEI